MLNILHSIDTPGPGGAETVYLDIVAGLDRTRFKSFPVIPAKGWLYDQLQERGIAPIMIDAKGSFSLRYLWQLIRVIKKNNIDLVLSHLLGSNVYCCLAGLLTSVPVLSTFHGFIDAGVSGKIMKSKVKFINQKSQRMIFVSGQLKKYFIAYYAIQSSRAEVIYNGIDTIKFKPGHSKALRRELGLTNNEILVGSIGNIRPAKGYDLLLRAAAEIKKNRQDVKFVIAGQGSGELYHGLLVLRDRLDLQDTVFFLGFVEDTVQLLQNIEVFLLCSKSEGFSLSLIEAMASGVPVIATRSGGPEEIIDHGNSGLLVNPDRPNEISESICYLLDHPEIKKSLINCAIQEVSERFSLSAMISSYTSLICKFS